MNRIFYRLLGRFVKSYRSIKKRMTLGQILVFAVTVFVSQNAFASFSAEVKTVDENKTTYIYAPSFVQANGAYHYFACWSQTGSGDVIGYKSATTLDGLAAAPMRVVYADPDKVLTCDPSVVYDDVKKKWLLFYGTETTVAVAESNAIAGPYKKLGDILTRDPKADPGSYGRGQPSVTKGPGGYWYMAWTNQIMPVEPASVVIWRSTDSTFLDYKKVQEVKRIPAASTIGWSLHLSYSPQLDHFLMIAPGSSPHNYVVRHYASDFGSLGDEFLQGDAGYSPGEGAAILGDAWQRPVEVAGVGGNIVASATYGPARGGYPTHITGPNIFQRFYPPLTAADPQGIVDDISSPSDGKVHVRGWAFDRSTFISPVEIHVYIGEDGFNLGGADQSRPDVNTAWGTGSNHGFDATLTTPLRGTQDVCVYAINQWLGSNTTLACQSVWLGAPIVPYNPEGVVDEVTSLGGGSIHIRGWAFDRSDLSAGLPIHVYVGTSLFGVGAGEYRPDVDAAYHVGNYHGFDTVIDTGLSGSQTVCIAAINVGAGDNTWLDCIPIDL